MRSDPSIHRFAWDGVSFLVPRTWNLSSHRRDKGVVSIEMEDDTAMRLGIEWVRPRQDLDAEKVAERHRALVARLSRQPARSAAIRGLPAGWTAFAHDMGERRRFVTASFLPSTGRFFALFRLHFDRDFPDAKNECLSRIASSLSLHEGPVVPWAFYDVSFEIGAEFRLAGASLQAGRKLMIFEWRLRRVLLWFFSLADLILKKQSLPEWAAGFLNQSKLLRGPRFEPQPDGRILAKRTWRYPYGHYEEIGRWCFRHAIGYRHIPERNQIALWACHYRREEDLRRVTDTLRV
jgi:hypothetical protein